MALNAYLKLAGVKQGDIKGSVTQKGKEGQIMVIAFNHDITAPIEGSSGLPTGKVKHSPITILKEIDRSTPALLQMLVGNEQIKSWVLRFWQPAAAGKEFQFYTIQLEHAMVTEIRQEMLNNKVPETMQQKEREYISFSYHKITWTNEETKQICVADW